MLIILPLGEKYFPYGEQYITLQGCLTASDFIDMLKCASKPQPFLRHKNKWKADSEKLHKLELSNSLRRCEIHLILIIDLI